VWPVADVYSAGLGLGISDVECMYLLMVLTFNIIIIIIIIVVVVVVVVVVVWVPLAVKNQGPKLQFKVWNLSLKFVFIIIHLFIYIFTTLHFFVHFFFSVLRVQFCTKYIMHKVIEIVIATCGIMVTVAFGLHLIQWFG